METNELKFVLKLLGFKDYRAELKAFDAFKAERNKICKALGDRELVDYTREITTVKISPPGQAVLKDPAQVPIADKELKVLEQIAKASGKIAPSKITSAKKAAERDAILQVLSDRGLIEVERGIKKTKAEVWLTQRAIEYLRDDYIPNKGSNPVLSLELLGNYLRFLRKTLRVKPEPVSPPPPPINSADKEISDEEILQIIEKLDRELGTDNYLPIFHLREKLQPPFSRDELDKALYRLQASDRIDLSSLLDPTPYTPEQIDAGILQKVGGSLFFITVN
ncbi:transcription factor RcaD [Nostoc linckia z18]|uniref:Transcription factor RcaD n=2 Tax=Nostoc linckia TaxID=92942 RepID=A0A9Q5Z5T7_NOSLI|nr:transcription factor RcaD [Nostoc linckia]PHK43042.1 transcription factor RcaD [Nostoc linckia z16]PHJ57574.1 transcription factor RcaD [Nostoc linckia z1]PHJ59776.1 transcription factor RcaD [Nostoc linckia z3]PHJ64544.1 transcription factor RcaD [Nostoc linckia z2]PHJ76254.1 transcription factor RcaD [Nostoc linckia z4]